MQMTSMVDVNDQTLINSTRIPMKPANPSPSKAPLLAAINCLTVPNEMTEPQAIAASQYPVFLWLQRGKFIPHGSAVTGGNTSLLRKAVMIAAILITTLSPPATAIQPAFWTHTTEADFSEGQTDNTVVTNLGDVKLATGTEPMGQISDEASVIHDLQVTANGDIYLATGPEGALLRKRGDKIDKIVSLPKQQIFSMDLLPDNRLLVAISGEQSRLAVLNGDALETLVELENVRYIWDMVIDGRDLFLATGTEGKLFRVNLNERANGQKPTVELLYDTAQNNLLCLDRDAAGRIYMGSDSDGLIYRVTIGNHDKPEVFVLYDAPEPEIGALLVLDDGTVYAGTADADQARPGRLEEAATDQSGRPESAQPAKPDAEPDPMPRVPPKPEPMDQSKPDEHAAFDITPQALSSASDQTNPTPSPRSTEPANQNSSRSVLRHRQHRSILTIDATAIHAPKKLQVDPNIAQPTADQRDALRSEIRHRLENARQSGTLKSSSTKLGLAKRFAAKKKSGASSIAAGGNASNGNAIYRISPDGFVTEIFRESVMILRLLEDPTGNDKLMVATGNEGQLFRVDPDAEETTILVDLDPQQVPAMVRDGQKHVLLGTANPATLMRLEAGFAQQGVYTSPVLDANQISLWGKINTTTTTPRGTSVTLQTRSGNVQDPDQANWSMWSDGEIIGFEPQGTALAPREVPVRCPPARFLQYRLTLAGHKQATPIVDRVQIAYVVPNLKPIISSIQANYPNLSEASGSASTTANTQANDQDTQAASILELHWEANDPNNDRLLFNLQYQPAGSTAWLTLAEDLEDDAFQWQTRRVPDGRYLVRVTASDHSDNPGTMAKTTSRRADPILVDNTAPAFAPLNHTINQREVHIVGSAVDTLASIRTVHFSLDSDDTWTPILPDDLIYDSTRETFTINITDLDQGSHVVTIRAIDSLGNSRHEALLLEIE